MLAVIIVSLIYLYGFLQFAFHGFRIGGSFILTAAVFLVGFFALAVWIVHHLGKPTKKQKEAARDFYDAVVYGKKKE